MVLKDESASRWLSKWMTEAKKFYISASALTLLSAGCFVVFSWYLSDFAATWLVLGQVIPQKLLYALAFLAGRYVFAHFSSLINYRAGNIIVSKIKSLLYPKLLNDNQSDAISSALLVTRVSDDLKPYFSFFIPYATASVLVGILLLIVSFWFEKWVGITLLITFVIIPLQMIMIGVGAESLHKKHINLFLKYSAVFYNRLHSIAEIVNLDNLKPQYQFLSEKSRALNQATTNVMRVAILSSAVLELFVSIAIAGVAIYLGMSLLGIIPGSNYGKGYDFHIALFLLMLAPYFFFYLRKFVSAYHDRNKALASAKLIMPLLKESSEAPVSVENGNLQSVEIKNLSFSYPDSMVKVLHNIHLRLPTKGLVLVKGISGSGKSTLLKILSGNLIVKEGLVSVNGNNNPWSVQWLKANSSYMNQFPFIFDGTLGYNVFLDREKETEGPYPEFLDKVLAKKEDGWQTVLSHNGKQLSGGEKQLVTLARMMLFPKPIAILDEPTANLDSETVAIILAQIEKMAQNKLLIVASHEEKFDAIANQILNLNWGEQMTYE
ncbi:ATP-binding cassette domain-containing protein [Geofilum rubicundum]|uniref:Transport ATP-binding protein CydD n=1 Tax=Geofilum rubicundum JCM 15548 TaxID=1236989 RepID=A0A0E9LSM8_9BACT|nr:ATP-binding cassette domain-containing protein [Geofilum rubicundum]GAO28577.1 transport ATP-binding protein CydD [Geofilum rubicundum JCM 15548]